VSSPSGHLPFCRFRSFAPGAIVVCHFCAGASRQSDPLCRMSCQQHSTRSYIAVYVKQMHIVYMIVVSTFGLAPHSFAVVVAPSTVVVCHFRQSAARQSDPLFFLRMAPRTAKYTLLHCMTQDTSLTFACFYYCSDTFWMAPHFFAVLVAPGTVVVCHFCQSAVRQSDPLFSLRMALRTAQYTLLHCNTL
jgi:hypothetical protein